MALCSGVNPRSTYCMRDSRQFVRSAHLAWSYGVTAFVVRYLNRRYKFLLRVGHRIQTPNRTTIHWAISFHRAVLSSYRWHAERQPGLTAGLIPTTTIDR